MKTQSNKNNRIIDTPLILLRQELIKQVSGSQENNAPTIINSYML